MKNLLKKDVEKLAGICAQIAYDAYVRVGHGHVIHDWESVGRMGAVLIEKALSDKNLASSLLGD